MADTATTTVGTSPVVAPPGDDPVAAGTTGTDGAPTHDTPTVGVPFTYSFDFDTNYCSVGVDEAAEYAPVDLRAQIRELDDDAALSLLNQHTTTAEYADDDERAEQCREAAKLLDYHNGCACASDAWDSDREYLDTLLNELGAPMWAISRNGNAEKDICDYLTYDRLRDILHWRDSWARLHVEWDGTKLTATFRDEYGGTGVIVAAALSTEQARLHACWGKDDPYHETIASEVLRTDLNTLRAAEQIADAFIGAGHLSEFGEYVDALQQLSVTEVPATALEIMLGLAQDDWSGTVIELLQTALLLRSVSTG